MISTHLSGFWNIFRKCAIHSIPSPVSPHPGHPWEGGKSRLMTCAPTYLPGQPLSNRSDVPSPPHGHLPSPVPNRHMPNTSGMRARLIQGHFLYLSPWPNSFWAPVNQESLASKHAPQYQETWLLTTRAERCHKTPESWDSGQHQDPNANSKENPTHPEPWENLLSLVESFQMEKLFLGAPKHFHVHRLGKRSCKMHSLLLHFLKQRTVYTSDHTGSTRHCGVVH